MNLQLNSTIYCYDGFVGLLGGVVVNPHTMTMTQLLVEEVAYRNRPPRLVATQHIDSAAGREINLKLSDRQIHNLPPLYELAEDGIFATGWGEISADYHTKLHRPMIMQHLNVPDAMRIVLADSRVEATNGHLGDLKSLEVDRATHYISEMTVCTGGFFWAMKNITIASSAVNLIGGDHIKLRYSKNELDRRQKQIRA